MNSANLLEAMQQPLMGLLDNGALLKDSSSIDIALDYHEQLGTLTQFAREHELLGLGHISRLFESGLQKRLCDEQMLQPAERAVMSDWPELVMSELIGGDQSTGRWTLIHRLCEQAWMPRIPDHFLTRLESLLADDAKRFGLAAGAEILNDDASTMEQHIGEVAVVVATPTVADTIANHEASLGEMDIDSDASMAIGESHDASATEGKVTAEELAMLRDALEQMREEFTPQFTAAGDAVNAALLESYAEQLENIVNATNHLGLTGLQNVIGVVQVNVMSLQMVEANAEAPSEMSYSLLMVWLEYAMAYLDAPNDSAVAQELVSVTISPEWPLPASEDTVAERTAELTSIEVIRARAAPERPAEAMAEHMDLRVPSDVDRDVLNSLLHELPQHAQEFSALVQRLSAGGAMEDLEHARRVAHTLKGAGNTVGVKGVGNLTHALEDILVACGREERMPSPQLQETLIEAADCLEAMSESLLSGDVAPPESVAVYQKVLDWANLIDRDGLPADDASVVLPTTKHAQSTNSAATVAPENNANATEETETYLRVPATLIDSLLKLVGENSIVTSQIQDRVARLTDDLNAQRTGSRQIRQLSSDLEQLVDVRGLAMMSGGTGELDALEMDQYNELHMLSRRIVESAADSREPA
jgi:HPt (histidine-containing phosphotransfer) domain-containing protein